MYEMMCDCHVGLNHACLFLCKSSMSMALGFEVTVLNFHLQKTAITLLVYRFMGLFKNGAYLLELVQNGTCVPSLLKNGKFCR